MSGGPLDPLTRTLGILNLTTMVPSSADLISIRSQMRRIKHPSRRMRISRFHLFQIPVGWEAVLASPVLSLFTSASVSRGESDGAVDVDVDVVPMADLLYH